jgi:hypothetical protein
LTKKEEDEYLRELIGPDYRKHYYISEDEERGASGDEEKRRGQLNKEPIKGKPSKLDEVMNKI